MKFTQLLGAAAFVCIGAGPAFGAGPGDADKTESAAKTSFATCFNNKIYKTGAFIDYQVRRSGDGGNGERQFVWDVGKVKKFSGANAVEIALSIGSETGLEYYSVNKGDLIRYGVKSAGTTLSYDPGEKFPGDLKSGDTFKQTSDVTLTVGGKSQTGESDRTLKFDGVETVRTPFGSFKACKLTEKSVITAKGSSRPVSTRTEVEWYAAEGPYRGFRLKIKQFGKDFGGNFNFTYTVIAINEYDVK